MKKLSLTSYMPYPSRKIRCICACTPLNTTKEQDSIRRIQRNPIRRIQVMECEYSGRYRTWSLLQEIPNTPYPTSPDTAYRPVSTLYKYKTLNSVLGTVFREPPYPFDYPRKRLTMEEILANFIDEGRREHEEMEIFIKEFRTTNELLLKTRRNLLSELKIEPHDDGVENKSSSIPEKAAHPLVKPQQLSIPFPNRVRKGKEEALQRIFLENLKQLDINISFIEALLQILKYAKYLKSLLTKKSRLEEACTETINERCSAVLLNELPSKEKDPRSFTTPCQVLEKHKEAEDLATDHLSMFENLYMEVLTKREIADKFSNEHLMVLKFKFMQILLIILLE
ncbi:hypothetical protein Tco_0896653, partial [Tanacetum coccineum]